MGIFKNIIRLEIGVGLIFLFEKNKLHITLEKIKDVRLKIEKDRGKKIPKIRIVDNLLLEPFEYSIFIKERLVGNFMIKRDENPTSTIMRNLEKVIRENFYDIFPLRYHDKIDLLKYYIRRILFWKIKLYLVLIAAGLLYMNLPMR